MADNNFTVPDRDVEALRFLRAYRVRAPEIDQTEGTAPWIDAQVHADMMMVVYGNLRNAAATIDLENVSGDALETRATDIGLDPARLSEAGSTGFVTIVTSTGGSRLLAGDELKDDSAGLRFQVISTAVYTSSTPVPVSSLDVGPTTNLRAGATLRFTFPRAGCNTKCTVQLQSDGSGLKGGRKAETDSELRSRIRRKLSTPAASGNDAAYQEFVESIRSKGIQKCFTYPAILGPGSVGIVVTMNPATSGGSRVPTSALLTEIGQLLIGNFPADDSVFMCLLVGSDVDVVLKVTWASTAAGWTDLSPWPLWDAVNYVKVLSVTDATHFVLTSADGAHVDPQVGQTIGFYDDTNGVFRKKRILTVSAGPDWTVVCDTTDNASDITYTPAANELCCPWSDSLDSLVAPVAATFDTLGPGEQVATFFDAGLRQKRSPPAPDSWPSSLGLRAFKAIDDLPQVSDWLVVSPTLPALCPTGTASIQSNIHELNSLLAFPVI